jgi:hypothetical protein
MSMGAQKIKASPELLNQVIEKAKKKEEAFLFDLKIDASDFGQPGSLRNIVLQSVLDEDYNKALEEIKLFSEGPSEFPNFIPKVTRYLNHSRDLVYAIKAKRNFDGISSLTRAKQQELREKFKEHYGELKFVLRRIEKIESDLRIEDARSTIYIIRALWIAAMVLVSVWFVMESVGGLAITGTIVVEDLIDKISGWLFGIIGW